MKLAPFRSNITKAILITFFSSLYFYSHIGTLYLQARGLNLVQISTLTALITISIFAAEVPTGIIGDKIGRKWSVVIAILLQAVGEYLYYFASSYLSFILIAILAGVGFAFLSGALESLIYESLPQKDRKTSMDKAMGKIGAAHQTAFVIAPLVGSFIVQRQEIEDYLSAVLVTAFSVTLAFILTLTLKETKKRYNHPEESPLVILKQGFNLIKNEKRLRYLVLFSVFTASFIGQLATIYQPFFTKNGISPQLIGLALTAAALLSALTQNFAYILRKLFGDTRSIYVTTIVSALFLVLLGLSSGIVMPILFFVLSYGFAATRDPLISSFQNSFIADKYRNTTLSLINMSRNLFVSVRVVCIGVIAEASLPFAFVAAGTSVFIAMLLFRLNGRGERFVQSHD